ncbi:MAG: hypothetical protein IJM74_07945 [Bacteroidales bacterium]|nr:hypothetical protein [Bacteroidales bacterium]
MSTQKLVTTEGLNPLGGRVEPSQCSQPTKPSREICKALGLKEAPFKKIKICRTQHQPDAPQPPDLQQKHFSDG